MTSWQSLLLCAQADVTIERITSLAATTGTEPLTVDFKEKATPRIAECVASMANSRGGLILVGITDTDRKVVGVRTETMAHVADMLCTRLDPADYLPEMFEVPVDEDQPGRHILVIRIRPGLAPRPVMVQRTIGSGGDKASIFWTPVRIPGGTRQATRAELAALFAEQPPTAGQDSGWNIQAPQIPAGKDGTPDPAIDMILKTGLNITPGPACPGRPLSEKAISELAAALDKSPLTDALFTLAAQTSGDLSRFRAFRRRGRPNTSGTATLAWEIAGDICPFDVTVLAGPPGQYGHSHVQSLTLTVEVVSRLSAWRDRLPVQRHPPGTRRRLDTAEWADLLSAIMATLTEPPVVAVISDLADVEPIVVPPPRILHLVSDQEIVGFLPEQLQPVDGATGSRGAHLQADPVLTLAEPGDRAQQVIRWLCQIAADAGLTGMEQLAGQLPTPASPELPAPGSGSESAATAESGQ
jgi:hypothetical protein